MTNSIKMIALNKNLLDAILRCMDFSFELAESRSWLASITLSLALNRVSLC